MRGRGKNRLILGMMFLLMFVAGQVQCASYALLVGIGSYQHLGPKARLEGPAYDISALQALLIERFHFDAGHITTLADQQAGKQAILDALDRLSADTDDGDLIFLYFSGHGTSAYDRENHWSMSPYTGAFLPADFNLVGGPSLMMQNLLVGSRDLRPRLKKLEQGRTVVVFVDACHSGYTVRSAAREPGIGYRYMSLDGEIGEAEPVGRHLRSLDNAPYPYSSTIYLAAASPYEKAIDITSMMISRGRSTFDGKPHGAFTDALLRGLSGLADGNHDENISIGELYTFVRNHLAFAYPQTPQLLKPDDVTLDRLLFSTRSHETLATSPVMPEKQKLPEQTFSGGIHPLKLSENKNAANRQDEDSRQNGLLHAARQQYRYELNLQIDPTGGILLEGQTISIRVENSQRMYLLLLSVAPDGGIEVIYPWKEDETAAVDNSLYLAELGRVSGPLFGKEYLIAFGFTEQPDFLVKLPGQLAMADNGSSGSFSSKDPLIQKIMEAARSGKVAAASVLPVTTCRQTDIVKQ